MSKVPRVVSAVRTHWVAVAGATTRALVGAVVVVLNAPVAWTLAPLLWLNPFVFVGTVLFSANCLLAVAAVASFRSDQRTMPLVWPIAIALANGWVASRDNVDADLAEPRRAAFAALLLASFMLVQRLFGIVAASTSGR